jgi:hypothetical protein
MADSGWVLVAMAVAAILLFGKPGGVAAMSSDPIFAIPENSPAVPPPMAPSAPSFGGGGSPGFRL